MADNKPLKDSTIRQTAPIQFKYFNGVWTDFSAGETGRNPKENSTVKVEENSKAIRNLNNKVEDNLETLKLIFNR